jgi:acetoin utilization protein AcuB
VYLTTAMSRDPICLRPEMTLLQARDLAAGKSIRHFPVTDADGRVLGMVSDRDLRSALPSTALSPTLRADQFERLGRVRVESIMSRPPIALQRGATLDDALLLFDRHRIGALAVTDHDGLLVGILTVRDVLAAYRRLFGIGTPGSSQVEVRDDGQPLLLTRIVGALEGVGILCTRLIRTEGRDGGPGTVYARLQTINLHGAHEALRAGGLEVVARKAGGAEP